MRLYLLTFLLALGCGDGEEDMVRIPRPIYDNEPEEPRAAAPVQVSVIDQKRGPWSANSSLGQFIEITPVQNQQWTILKMSEWGMPSVRTVALGLEVVDLTMNSSFGMTAHCIVGAGGTTIEFDMDFKNGSAFSMPMNTIEIIAKPNQYISSTPTYPKVRLSAFVGKDPKDGNSVTYSRWVSKFASGVPSLLLAGDTSYGIEIPKFAKRVRLYNMMSESITVPNNLFNAGILVSFEGVFPFVPPISGITTYTSIMTPAQAYYILSVEGISIPEGARTLVVKNGTADEVGVMAEFELDL